MGLLCLIYFSYGFCFSAVCSQGREVVSFENYCLFLESVPLSQIPPHSFCYLIDHRIIPEHPMCQEFSACPFFDARMHICLRVDRSSGICCAAAFFRRHFGGVVFQTLCACSHLLYESILFFLLLDGIAPILRLRRMAGLRIADVFGCRFGAVTLKTEFATYKRFSSIHRRRSF